MKKFLLLCSLLVLLSGCSVTSDKFGLDPGLDGCVVVKVSQFDVTGTVTAKDVSYHRINEKCKDVPYHHEAPAQ